MNKQLVLLAFIGISLSATAQLDLGGKAGLNYHFQSTSKGDMAPSGMEDPEGTNGLGFHVGVFARIPLSDKLGLRPELLYSTRSSTSQLNSSIELLGTTTTVDAETKGTLSYLEIPLLLDLAVNEGLSLQVGPAFGFMMGNKVTVTGNTSVTTGGQTVTTSLNSESNSTDGLNTLEIAGVIGLGYRLENGLDLGLRYWRGFTTLEEDADLTKTYQNLVQVSLGYAFLRN
jgi:hypothetical protein